MELLHSSDAPADVGSYRTCELTPTITGKLRTRELGEVERRRQELISASRSSAPVLVPICVVEVEEFP